MFENSNFDPKTSNFQWLVGQFVEIIDVVVLTIFALALVVLIWKIISTWIIKGGDVTAVEEGKQVITVSIIVLVVMSSIWGIIALLRTSIF
jgi:hypothetical protein